MKMTTLVSERRRQRAGFTLIELLVVLGIIVLLISILLPVVFSVQKKAETARMRQDLDTIAVALEEYKKVFGDYPRQTILNKSPHDRLLVTYLLGPNGEGIRDVNTSPTGSAAQGGKKWGPYLPVGKFKLDPTGTQLLDRGEKEIQYYPRYNAYDARRGLTASVSGDGYLLGQVNVNSTSRTPRAMFNRHEGLAGDGVASDSDDHQKHTLYMLGDGGDGPLPAANNTIDGTETLSFSGPFMLISAGPDTKWGLGAGTLTRHTEVDDVYNFGR